MKREYDVFRADDFVNIHENHPKKCIDKHYVLARPERYRSIPNRIKIAYKVLVGKYDALKWYKQ